MRVVKAFARQDYEIDKFERDNWEKFRRGRLLLLMHSLYWPSSDILAARRCWSGSSPGRMMAINGTITVGTYLAYAGLVIWIIWPMRNLGRLIVQMSTGLVSYDRVVEIIKEEREPLTAGDCQPHGDVRGEIEFRGRATSATSGGEQVLRGTSVSAAQPGQRVALLGSTGSGKTSLVNLLPRFYEYTGGSITLDGVELKRYPRATICAARSASSSRSRSSSPASSARTSPTAWAATRPDEEVVAAARSRGHPRCDPQLPGRLQHAGRRAGRDALGRAEAAGGHRPHPVAQTRAS